MDDTRPIPTFPGSVIRDRHSGELYHLNVAESHWVGDSERLRASDVTPAGFVTVYDTGRPYEYEHPNIERHGWPYDPERPMTSDERRAKLVAWLRGQGADIISIVDAQSGVPSSIVFREYIYGR